MANSRAATFSMAAAGADTLKGGTGNDFYFVDNIGDVVRRVSNRGHRHRQALDLYTAKLTANVENLLV